MGQRRGEPESDETPQEGGDREPQIEQSSSIPESVSAISLGKSIPSIDERR
jgi:hypothetical protein